MKGVIIYLLFTGIIILGCNNFGSTSKREIIKKDNFIDILTDIHKAGSLIEFKNLQAKNNVKADSVSLYNFILKKHNVSREKFRKTIDYYAEHYEDYLIIYDSVQSKLKREEKELQIKAEQDRQKKLANEKLKKDSADLWMLKKEWSLPKDGKTNPIPFNIKTMVHGTYVLKAKIKIFPDDRSVNQRMTIIANYSDGTKDINSNGTMVKDAKFGEFDVSIQTNSDKELKSISGWLLDHSKGTKYKHAEVKDISLKIIKPDKTDLR